MSTHARARILARREMHSAHSHAIILAVQSPGDPLVSVYHRYWCDIVCAMDDAPEVRIRCKPQFLRDVWAQVIDYLCAFVPGETPDGRP